MGDQARQQAQSSIISLLSFLENNNRVFFKRNSAWNVLVSGRVICPGCAIQNVTELVFATNGQFNRSFVRTIFLFFQGLGIPAIEFTGQSDRFGTIDGFGRQFKGYFRKGLAFEELFGNCHRGSLFGFQCKVIIQIG